MFHSIEAVGHGERSTLSQLSKHGQSFFVVPTVYTWFARKGVPGEITEQAIEEIPVPAK